MSHRRYLGGLLIFVSMPFAVWGYMAQCNRIQRITTISPARQDQAVNLEIYTPYLMRLGESAKLRVAISLETLDLTADEGKDLVEIQGAGSGAIGNTTYLSRVRFELASLPVIPTGVLIETFSDSAPGVFCGRSMLKR